MPRHVTRSIRWVFVVAALGCNPQALPQPDATAAGQGTTGGDEPVVPFEPRAIAPEGEHPFSARDVLAMQRISGVSPSPDGTKLVYGLRSTDLEQNRGRTDLWIVDAEGGPPRQLTRHPEGDSSALWVGDTIYFLSGRSESNQVWRVPAAGGEPTQVTDLPVPVANLVASHDGNKLAFTAEMFPDCDTLACTAKRESDRAAEEVSGRLYEGLFMRHWDTWKDGRRSHLFVMPASGGDPIDVTAGMNVDVPAKPFGGAEDITFSPDGSQIVFAARDAGREEPWSTNFDLFAVPSDGSAKPGPITADNPAWDAHPVFSPDGKMLAYLAMKRTGYEADRFRIVVREWPDGPERVVTEAWDRSVRGLVFGKDGKTLFVTAQQTGQVALFAIDVESGAVKELLGDGTVHGITLAADRIVFLRNDLMGPDEIYSCALDGSDVQPVTNVNAELVARAHRGEAEQFTFKGHGGDTVYGYVVRPADFDAKRRYPIAFLIHGGPQGSFGNRFHYRWNPQTYAGAGYAAVMIDFHGSTGYGQAFTDAIRGDWGGKPLVDLQKGLAAALERYAWLDGDRVCALGASYGGYMVNWIAGNWSDRFRCLVNHDGIFDNRMMYYTTEELWFPEWEHGGPYWERAAAHEKHNPAAHVAKWKTPMLVVHGALDYRVPETQGIATFTALQRKGIESQMLQFPDENHWVLKPHNSLLWHDTVTGWLDRWLKAED